MQAALGGRKGEHQVRVTCTHSGGRGRGSVAVAVSEDQSG